MALPASWETCSPSGQPSGFTPLLGEGLLWVGLAEGSQSPVRATGGLGGLVGFYRGWRRSFLVLLAACRPSQRGWSRELEAAVGGSSSDQC